LAQRAVGTKFQIGAQYVAELSEIGGLDLSADTIDVTALDSTGGYRSFIGGFKDAGEVSLSGFFNPGDLGQAALYNDFLSGVTDNFTILFPFGASWTFAGVITGFKTSAALEDAISFEATVKVSGQPTLNLTASAALTNLALTGTAGTLSPAYSTANSSYSYSFTGSGLTVTATLAGATYDVYVDGALFQAGIASGAASQSITFSAVGSKKITVIEREASKSPRIYDIVAIRTA
jgi:predicted secreted protein